MNYLTHSCFLIPLFASVLLGTKTPEEEQGRKRVFSETLAYGKPPPPLPKRITPQTGSIGKLQPPVPKLASWLMFPVSKDRAFGKDNPSIEQQILDTSGYFNLPTGGSEVTIKGAVETAIPACPPEVFITGELLSQSRHAATFKAIHKETGKTALRKDVLINVKGMREFDMQLRLSLKTKFVGRVYCVNSRASDHYFNRTIVKPKGWPKKLEEGSGIPGSPPPKHKKSPLPPDQRPVSVFMEYFGKGDLQSIVLQWQGMLSPLRNLLRTQWLAEIYAGINRVHKLEYILFDIKPENIAVASDGHVRLIDFGLSLPYKQGGIFLKKARGTANYRAPEVRSTVDKNGHVLYHPQPVGYTVDYYSYGILLYAMFEGTAWHQEKHETCGVYPKNTRLL